MSFAPYDDYMPCSVPTCDAMAHVWDYDPPDDGEIVIRISAELPLLIVYLCKEHRPVFAALTVDEEPIMIRLMREPADV